MGYPWKCCIERKGPTWRLQGCTKHLKGHAGDGEGCHVKVMTQGQWGVGMVVRVGEDVEVVGSLVALRKYVNVLGINVCEAFIDVQRQLARKK